MRKFVILATLLALMMSAGCTGSPPASTAPSAEATTVPTIVSPTSPDATHPEIPELPEYLPGSIELEDQSNDDYDFQRKYRIAYYRIWGEYMDLLDDEKKSDLYDWLEEESQKTNYGELMDEMLLVSFVKRYNITREEFDAATAKFAENVKNDTHTEECEVPNGDIIYTFDNEIINHYYRYE